MKTKMMFKYILACLTALWVSATFSGAYAQSCPGSQIAITVENIRSTSSKTIAFEVYVANTGTTALSLASIQGALVYDKQMIPQGANVTFNAITSSKASDFAQFNPITTKHTTASNQLRWFQNPVARNSKKTASLPAGKKLRFAAFEMTCSQPLNTSLIAKMKPQLEDKAGYTNLMAVVYCNDNTNSVVLKPATAVQALGAGATNFNAVAYPNPFSENFHLTVDSASGTDITIKVYDMLGKLIENRTIEMGLIENTLIGANYPAGIYNVNISQGGNDQTLRIIKR